MSEVSEIASFGVAQLVDNLAVGGAENLAVRIANEWAAQGRPAFLYVLRKSGPLADRVNPGVKVRFLDVHRQSITNPWAFGRSLIRGRRKILAQLALDEVGVVQSHLTSPNFWSLFLDLTSHVTCFPTIHNNQEFQYGSEGLKGRLNRWAYRLMVKRCGGVVACSEEVRSSLVETLDLGTDPGGQLVSIPNAVPKPEPVSEADSLAARHSYGIPLEVPLILGAGRLTDQKNFSLLLAAAAEVLAKVPETRVLIAGEGELRADLESQALQLGIQDRVIMPGNVDDLDSLMETADVFVLSSRFEGLPLVLLESMSHGMATVCTRIKGTEDVITHGQNGWLVAPDSVPELAQAVTQILGDPGLARELGIQARKTIQTRYSFAVLMDRLADLYTRGLNK